jgi:hypothetical protein
MADHTSRKPPDTSAALIKSEALTRGPSSLSVCQSFSHSFSLSLSSSLFLSFPLSLSSSLSSFFLTSSLSSLPSQFLSLFHSLPLSSSLSLPLLTSLSLLYLSLALPHALSIWSRTSSWAACPIADCSLSLSSLNVPSAASLVFGRCYSSAAAAILALSLLCTSFRSFSAPLVACDCTSPSTNVHQGIWMNPFSFTLRV